MINGTDVNARAMRMHTASKFRDLTVSSYPGKGSLNMHPLLAQGIRESMLCVIFPWYQLPAIEEKIDKIF